ncbi:MAG: NAD(P)-binding domain-containing protein [Chitinophagaceae bacterium]
MGTPIAENLLTNTKQLYVYNRTASKAKTLVEKGALLCASVKELAAACDTVFSIVSDDAALKQITTGEEGIAIALVSGRKIRMPRCVSPRTGMSICIVGAWRHAWRWY